MGMIAGNEQEKSQLVTEICDISARAIACAKLHHAHTRKLPFVNWYLVLRVNENADIYVIRKQYHKLALQLHPDKNKHSKAETAFKLVSEIVQKEPHLIHRGKPLPAPNASTAQIPQT
ncbi:chaperone protein dnaj [Phtheirospermum japonicum]|uniref:Chaperone protein dnaj n=1 Tax=Phtheirospermum japonicum TaxID=374723 RepID=A0A830BN35_9LAMI|nr:chaperone protein dnaj [Phtheirospermum japonicum]